MHIRPLRPEDLDAVMQIWLEGNLSANSFIPHSYWLSNKSRVRQELSEAEVYVAQEDFRVLGFLRLEGNEIRDMFVQKDLRNRNVGKALLDYAKSIRHELELHIYKQNERAIRFYKREDMSVIHQGMDFEIGRPEWVMGWSDHKIPGGENA